MTTTLIKHQKDQWMIRVEKILAEIGLLRQEIQVPHYHDDSKEATIRFRLNELLHGTHKFVSKTYEILGTL